MRKLNDKKGFTLAELLIVVAIIAILAAIATPLFFAQKDKAEVAVVEGNARDFHAECIVAVLQGPNAEGKIVTEGGVVITEGTGTDAGKYTSAAGIYDISFATDGKVTYLWSYDSTGTGNKAIVTWTPATYGKGKLEISVNASNS